MNVLNSLLIGAASSIPIAVPLMLWAKKKGAYAYASGRARGMKNKFFTEQKLRWAH